jgi:hypothetical protein
MKDALFQRMTETPVEPPFLVPDAVWLWRLLTEPDTLDPTSDLPRIEAEAGRVLERHIERMAAQNVVIKKPQKLSPLIADSTVGLVFDQAAAQRAALTGRYAETYFGDRLAALRQEYAELGEAIAVLTGQRETAAPERVQALIQSALVGQPADHPLRLLYAAWQFRRQVVSEGQAMSMVPLVSGEAQGDTPSFTPVLQRVGDNEWQLGWPGDPAPASPQVFTGEIDAVWPAVAATYSAWYQRDQEYLERNLSDAARKLPEHLYIPVWARRLQDEHDLRCGEQGEVVLTNISHGRLFRLAQGDTEQLFRGTTQQAVRLTLAAAGGKPPAEPEPAEIEAAYLYLLTKRGETGAVQVVPTENGVAAPLETPVTAVYAVLVNGQPRMRVAWLKGHPKAMAVVSGPAFPARAVLLPGQNPARLGLAPFSFKTRQPDLTDVWSATPLPDGLDLTDPATQRAVSAWAAWVWQGKAGQQKYQPGGKK